MGEGGGGGGVRGMGDGSPGDKGVVSLQIVTRILFLVSPSNAIIVR